MTVCMYAWLFQYIASPNKQAHTQPLEHARPASTVRARHTHIPTQRQHNTNMHTEHEHAATPDQTQPNRTKPIHNTTDSHQRQTTTPTTHKTTHRTTNTHDTPKPHQPTRQPINHATNQPNQPPGQTKHNQTKPSRRNNAKLSTTKPKNAHTRQP